MNWTSRRIARMPAIAVSSFKVTLKRKASPPSASSDIYGKCLLGCRRPKIGKKFPSTAAEYGTREYPSKTENTEASATHRTIQVAACAACAPYNLSTNVLTINFEFCASRQGTT